MDQPAIERMWQLIQTQRAAHREHPFPELGVRKDRIRRVVSMLLENEPRICEAVDADFNGRSADMTAAMDLLAPLSYARYLLKHLADWMKPLRRRCNFPFGLLGAKAEVNYLPLGVVGNISPWNFPINLTFGPLCAIFAAGNRCMIKPSELSPATSAVIADMVARNFDEAELAVVTGDARVAAEFASLPFDHLLFTGSTTVAKRVMEAAAKNLVPVTLELGGKSPVVVSRTADLEDAARKIMFGKLLNAGQICLAPDYLMVPADMLDAAVNALKHAGLQMYPRLAGNPDYTHIINERHFQRLMALIEDAEQAGADCIRLHAEEEADAASRMLPPLIITGASDSLKVMQEEIFGPILPVITYARFDDVPRHLLAGERPLALYYFGNDAEEMAALRRGVISGGMTINDVLVHYTQDDLPFGGVGASGMGAYHGMEGFRNFSHARAVDRQSRIDLGKFLRPPISARTRAIVRSQLKL